MATQFPIEGKQKNASSKIMAVGIACLLLGGFGGYVLGINQGGDAVPNASPSEAAIAQIAAPDKTAETPIATSNPTHCESQAICSIDLRAVERGEQYIMELEKGRFNIRVVSGSKVVEIACEPECVVYDYYWGTVGTVGGWRNVERKSFYMGADEGTPDDRTPPSEGTYARTFEVRTEDSTDFRIREE